MQFELMLMFLSLLNEMKNIQREGDGFTKTRSHDVYFQYFI